MSRIAHVSRLVTVDPRFHFGTLALIVLNGLRMGLETLPEIMARFGPTLLATDGVIQALFVPEISLRVVSSTPWSSTTSRGCAPRSERLEAQTRVSRRRSTISGASS